MDQGEAGFLSFLLDQLPKPKQTNPKQNRNYENLNINMGILKDVVVWA